MLTKSPKKNTFLRSVAALGSSILVVTLLSACVGTASPGKSVKEFEKPVQTTEPAPVPEVTEEPIVIPVPEVRDREALADEYVTNIRSYVNMSNEDEEIRATGLGLCSAMDKGTLVEQLFQVAYENEITSYDAGFIIGFALGGVCPEYRPELEQYILDHPTSTQ